LRLLPRGVVLALALVGSVGVHVPIYGALGWLAGQFRTRPREAPLNGPIEFALLDAFPSGPKAPDEPEHRNDELARRAGTRPELPSEQAQAAPERDVPLEREVSRPRAPEPMTPQSPDRPREIPEIDERRAIVQRSRDPTVEAPEDARFIAEEANDVEEETVAAVTQLERDDRDPRAAPLSPDGPASERERNPVEDRATDRGERAAEEERVATPTEPERTGRRDHLRPVDPQVTVPAGEPTPPREAGSDPRGREGEHLATGEERRPVSPSLDFEHGRGSASSTSAESNASAEGGGEPVAAREIVVSDGSGTFRIRVPRELRAGQGPGEAGGRRIEGSGRADPWIAASSSPGHRGADGAGGEGASRARQGAVGLGLSWADFESIFGEDELRRQREAHVERPRVHRRGTSRQERWEQFRAAIENYVPEVRPGNQTALDAAASPFARFLSDMHRRIHREFADGYLASLDLDSPESDPTLHTTLEIAVNPDGTLHRVGVIATSGNILFDYGAWSSVVRAQPFPPPPAVILSGDGHAWLHWRFDRGPRQCGTWNARPFLLNNAPLIDRGEPPSFPNAMPSGATDTTDEG
jgi:hypothetical protein